MPEPKKNKAPKLDMRKTAQKAADFRHSDAEMLDIGQVIPGATANIHPEPVDGPVMPAEVFYNRITGEEDS